MSSTKIIPLLKRNVGIKTNPPKIFGRISLDQKIHLVEHLATMLKTEIPLKDALAVLENHVKRFRLKKFLANAVQNLSAGENFSSTLKNYPKIFDEVFVTLVSAGEKNDNLEIAFKELALFLQKEKQMKQIWRRAALRLKPACFWKKDKKQKEILALFWRALSSLLKTGVSLPQAIDIAARTSKNRLFHHLFFNFSEQIKKGATLGSLLEEHPKFFSATDRQMVWVAEKSNSLPEISSELADLYEEELKQIT